MADVTLILKADNSQYVRSMKEAQQASQKVYDTVEKGIKREKGLIEDIENELTRLHEARKKANSIEDITKYNKKIQEAKRDLKEYEEAGVKANENIAKSTDKLGTTLTSLAKKYGLLGTAIAALTKVGRDLVNTFKDTVGGLNIITSAGELYKQVLYNLVQGTNDLTHATAQALATARLANELRVRERKDLVDIAKLRTEYNKLYFESSDRTQEDNDRLVKINEAMGIHNKMIDLETGNLRENLLVVLMQLSNRPKSNKLLDEAAKLEAALADAESRRYSEVKRLETQRTNLEKEIWEKKKQRYFDEIEANNKLQDEKLERQKQFQALSLKLVEEYERANIESLEGTEKLEAQRNYELKALEMMKEQMRKLGTLTPQQEELFRQLGGLVWASFFKGIKEESDKEENEVMKVLDETITRFMKDDEKRQHEENKAILDWLDEEVLGRDKKRKESLKENIESLTSELFGSIDDIYQKRVQDAQRTRELYDNQISELQQTIETEVELYKAGYASNVRLKQQQLDALKQKRDQALKDEQKALDKSRAIELAIQSVNLATSITALFKEEIKSKGVYGLITGAVAAGAFLLLWDQYKNQAKSAAKLGEGGSGTDRGIVTGKSHAAGGERFTDQIEVERGEAWGVLSVPATQKFGKVFHEMVSSFNRGELPQVIAPAVNSNVYVENNGPNSRLERLIGEQKKLNERFSNMETVQELGKYKVIQKGANTRIIKR